MNKKFGTSKVVLALLSIVVMVAVQLLAVLVSEIFTDVLNLEWLGNIFFCVIYVIGSYFLLKLLCQKILGLSLAECRAGKITVRPIWIVCAFVLPFAVSGILVLTPGNLVTNDLTTSEIINQVTYAMLWAGLAVGIVEELVFRGIIMTALEKRWNKQIAILIPSMMFGLLHAIDADLGIISVILLFVAGTGVGILFSPVTYESGSIWNSAIIHVVWNCVMVGGILDIGVVHDESAVFSYILDSESYIITGGDFGVEASIISVCGYMLFSVLALVLIKRNKEKMQM